MTLLWTEPGLNDLKAIRDYIAKDSETYAAGFIESLLSAVEQLREFPAWEGWSRRPMSPTSGN